MREIYDLMLPGAISLANVAPTRYLRQPPTPATFVFLLKAPEGRKEGGWWDGASSRRNEYKGRQGGNKEMSGFLLESRGRSCRSEKRLCNNADGNGETT